MPRPKAETNPNSFKLTNSQFGKLPGQDLNLKCEDQNLECCQLHHRVKKLILAVYNMLTNRNTSVKGYQKIQVIKLLAEFALLQTDGPLPEA